MVQQGGHSLNLGVAGVFRQRVRHVVPVVGGVAEVDRKGNALVGVRVGTESRRGIPPIA